PNQTLYLTKISTFLIRLIQFWLVSIRFPSDFTCISRSGFPRRKEEDGNDEVYVKAEKEIGETRRDNGR
ncbi:hypothetical protein Gogos_009928, partial [Gossypium gossypioides]|nr:hypothetical protein [Gossypium gossypioides]